MDLPVIRRHAQGALSCTHMAVFSRGTSQAARPRRHRAADQRPRAERRRRLPPVGRHDDLRPFPGGDGGNGGAGGVGGTGGFGQGGDTGGDGGTQDAGGAGGTSYICGCGGQGCCTTGYAGAQFLGGKGQGCGTPSYTYGGGGMADDLWCRLARRMVGTTGRYLIHRYGVWVGAGCPGPASVEDVKPAPIPSSGPTNGSWRHRLAGIWRRQAESA